MVTELVEIMHKQAITTSLKVAEYFGRNHRDVLKAIDHLVNELDNLKVASEQESAKVRPLQMFEKSSYSIEGQLREYPFYYMNRDGFSLLVMGFNNTPKVLQFKLDYIAAFSAMEQRIMELEVQRQNEEWRAARKLTKFEFRQLTDTIRDILIPRMEAEGASEAAKRWVYKNYVSMVQKLLGIGKGTRDELPIDLLYELGKVEQMARIIIRELDAKGTVSRQIYAGTKSELDSYAQLSYFNQRFLQ